MYFKSNTHNFSPSSAQKEGDIPPIKGEEDSEPNNVLDYSDSTRSFPKHRKTKKSVFYAEQSPYEMKVRLNLDEANNSFNEIKDRNNSSTLTPNVDLSLFDDLEGNNGDFNMKVYLRRRYALAKKKNYFAPEDTWEKNDENFSDIIENEIFFNVENFLLFFLYHFFFHFLFGPLTMLITYRFTGSTVFKNQFFWGLNWICFLNYLVYILYLILMVVYFSCESLLINLNSVSIYMVFPILFLRIFIISIKYATINKEKIKMIKSRVINQEELLQEFTFVSWAWQTDSCIEKELQATIQRTELDLAMFKFSFLSIFFLYIFFKENKLLLKFSR